MTKVDSPDPVAPGGTLDYTLTVHNAGPDSAQNVNTRDQLPANTTFASASVSQGTVMYSSGTIDASFGTIASGADATLTVQVTVNSAVAAGTVIGNPAVAWSTRTRDPNHTNNTAIAPTLVSSLSGTRICP